MDCNLQSTDSIMSGAVTPRISGRRLLFSSAMFVKSLRPPQHAAKWMKTRKESPYEPGTTVDPGLGNNGAGKRLNSTARCKDPGATQSLEGTTQHQARA